MITLHKLASIVEGKIIGAPELLISGISDIKNGAPNTITFLFNSKFSDLINQTTASAIIVSDATLLKDKNGIVVNNPRLAMAKILKLFEQLPKVVGIHKSVIVPESTKWGNNVAIGAFTVIGKNVRIGDNVVIHNNVSISDNVVIGNNTIIYPQVSIFQNATLGNNIIIDMGSVIGSCGYGYETENDIHYKIPQLGSVIIEDDVEIGANCTIDRGTIENTIISRGCKLDNQVHIAHNVKLGRGCLLMAQVGIAGGTTIGNYCIFAGQSGVKDGVMIGDRAIFVAKTGVTKSLPGGKIYAGMPAREVREKNKYDAAYLQIITLKKRLRKLEEKLVK